VLPRFPPLLGAHHILHVSRIRVNVSQVSIHLPKKKKGGLPILPALGQINLVHALSKDLIKIHFNIIFLPSSLPTKILYAFVFSHILATCPSYFILFDLIILITLGWE